MCAQGAVRMHPKTEKGRIRNGTVWATYYQHITVSCCGLRFRYDKFRKKKNARDIAPVEVMGVVPQVGEVQLLSLINEVVAVSTQIRCDALVLRISDALLVIVEVHGARDLITRVSENTQYEVAYQNASIILWELPASTLWI